MAELNRYLDRIEERPRLAMQQSKETKICIEFVWFALVWTLYIFILNEVDEPLDWRYNFFFIEQICTILVFLIVQKCISSRIGNSTLFASANRFRYYDLIRSAVYLVEIFLMVYVQWAFHFYGELVEGDNIFLEGIAYGLYAQIAFWGGLVFILYWPCYVCCDKRP